MCKSRSVAGHPSRESRHFGLPTALGARRSSRRAAQFLARLLCVSGLVRSGVTSLARSVPPSHESITRVPPRELHGAFQSVSCETRSSERRTSRRRRTLMSAVVAPMAAATGMLGTMRALSQGRAVPRTVPASAAVAAPTAAYFWAQQFKSESQGASQQR